MSIYLDHNAGAPICGPRCEQAVCPLWRSGRRQSRRRCIARVRARAVRSSRLARRSRALIGAAAARDRLHQRRHRVEQSRDSWRGRRAPDRRRDRHLGDRAFIDPRAARILAAAAFEIVRIAPDRDGANRPMAVAAALDADTALVTIGLANAEVGTIQDVAAMAEPIAARERCCISTPRRPPAGSRFDVARSALRSDDAQRVTSLAHRRESGAFTCATGVAIAPQILGGPQEGAMRAGNAQSARRDSFGCGGRGGAGAMDSERARIDKLAGAMLERLFAAIPGSAAKWFARFARSPTRST